MIEQVITYFDTLVTDSTFVDRWGGYCEVDQNTKPFPTGISKTKDVKGNTFTYDDRVKTNGFLELGKTRFDALGTQFGYLNIPIIIHIFTNRKKVAQAKYYSVAIALLDYLKKHTEYQNKTWQYENIPHLENLHAEYSKITITVRLPMDCNISPDNNPQCC